MPYYNISGVTRKLAEFLKLKNPALYIGHGLRRSLAAKLVKGGGDLLTLKRHGEWRLSAVAEGYIEESSQNGSEETLSTKTNIADNISGFSFPTVSKHISE